jgi:hypothetical protein
MALAAAPDWWDWELELTPHVEKRMEERGLTEVELRALLQDATLLVPDVVEARWVATGKRGSETWEIILEPDLDDHVVVVVTAYRVG